MIHIHLWDNQPVLSLYAVLETFNTKIPSFMSLEAFFQVCLVPKSTSINTGLVNFWPKIRCRKLWEFCFLEEIWS
jgi:hypothetical protein